jgi:hypothetical protein
MSRIKNVIAALTAPTSPGGNLLASSMEDSIHRPSPNAIKQLQIEDALNGKVITFALYKWNPNGPDTHERMMYVVGADESLLDGIAAVITMMEAQHGKRP